MHIVLIRHAESENNAYLHHKKLDEFHKNKVDNPKLTEKGIRQAENLGFLIQEYIEAERIDFKVWSSPLTRAKHTASLATGEENIDIEIKEELREFDRKKEDWDQAVERVGEFYKLLVDFEKEFSKHKVQDHFRGCIKPQVLFVFGHSLFFSMLTSTIISEGQHTSLVLEFPNCSITNMYLKDGKFNVFSVAEVEHLDRDLQTAVHTIFGGKPRNG